jgi:hypothetical protein
MAHKRRIKVFDEITERTFIFNSHADKRKFFDAWDDYVVEVK